MTQDELIEKVARAISDEVNSKIPAAMHMTYVEWLKESRAAIRVVLEEAAKVAEEQQQMPSPHEATQLYNIGCRTAAWAIRALIPGEGE